MGYTVCIDRPGKVRLSEMDPDDHAGLDREQGESEFQQLGEELATLQELLYGAGRQSLLVVLQGMDASGKDGVLRHVLGYLNPQGLRITSFKVPTEEERTHDFLWRIHPHAPRRGMVAAFNRSHYEDVLVVRVHKLVPEPVWQSRYETINRFEELLATNDTLILKFFLHISEEEQEQRFRDREKAVEKAWKLSAEDWKKRLEWPAYQEAYQEAISRCSATHAPWHIVPANRKWFRNLAIARAMVEALRPHAGAWREELEARGRRELAAIRAYREESGKA